MVFGERGQRLLDILAPFRRQVDQGREQLAGEEERRCRAAAVQFIAHVKRPLHDRLQRDAAAAADRLADDRRDDLADMEQALLHARVVDAVVEPARIGALVHVAVGTVAAGAVFDDEDRHGGAVDAGQRSNAFVIVAAIHFQLAGAELGVCFFCRSRKSLEEGGADDRIALAADVVGPSHGRPRR